MRWWNAALFTAAGWGLLLLAQWGASGAPGLPAAAPVWIVPALPDAALLLFGLYLAAVGGGETGRALCVVQAGLALAVAAMPIAYAYGIAGRLGLPGGGGPLGTLMAGSLPRSLAVVWMVLAAAAAWRGRRTPVRQQPAEAAAPDPPSYWAPAVTADPQPAPHAPLPYTPPIGGEPADGM